MHKKRLAALAVGLLLVATMFLPSERASAHAVYSGYSNPSSGGVFFTHFGSLFDPLTTSAMVYVDFDPNGFKIGTTTVVSMGNGSYRLRAYDRCTDGSSYSSSWQRVSGPGFWVRGSGCSGNGKTISRGQGGIWP